MTASGRYANKDGLLSAISRARRFLRPPPDLCPSEWAESHVSIPLGNAVPGPIRFENAPYQIEPLNAFADPEVERITLMWGAQTGKTQIINCALGYFIAHDPSSQMMMQPSQSDLHTWLETKFNPMVENTEALSDSIAKPRSREGVNNQTMKSYPGGFLMFSWAGSPRTMRGRSAPKIYCDEVDGYDYNAEGHPVSLLWQRAATFGDQRKLLVTSTPTIKGSSFVEDSFENGDKRRFYIPCPHCEKEITLKWSQVLWDKDEQGNHLPDTAIYACQECGSPISDGEKRAALKKGRWIGEKPFTGHASFHLSELYSAFRRWKDIVRSFLEKKATNDIQSFVNLSLAETWEEQGERVDDYDLAQRREEFNGKIPAEAVILTAGVDVQDNRLEVSIVAWGRDEESYVIDHKTLYGDPSTPQLWMQLDTVLKATYHTLDGREMPIRSSCVDSGGHFTNAVYAYCKKNAGKRIFAIKGVGGEGRPLVSRPSKNNVGKCMLFPVGVDTAKDMLFARLAIKDPGAGYVHFSDTLDEEYFKQLTAEQIVTRYKRGFKHRVYEQIRKRNEALDCFVYALAALTILNVQVNTLADRLQFAHNKQLEPVDEAEAGNIKRRKLAPRAGNSFVNAWR